MGIEYLLNGRGLVVWIDVPYLKFAVQSAYEQVIIVDLVKERRVLMIVNLVLNCPISCLYIHVADKNLFVIEATDSQNS